MKTHMYIQKRKMTFLLFPAAFPLAESESSLFCMRTIQTYKRKRDRERIQKRRQNAMCPIMLAIMDSGKVTCVHMHSYLYLYTLVRGQIDS